mgnify:CR=1 FL=1
MKVKFARPLFALISIFFVLVQPALAESTAEKSQLIPRSVSEKSHLIWEGKIADSTVHLMGSIHYGMPSMYPLPKRIMSAFERSTALLVEVDISKASPASTMALIKENGFYQDGSTLKDHLTASQFTRLERDVAQWGVPVSALLQHKPWLVVMSLTAIAVKAQGYSETLGVDQYFLDRIGSKKVIEIESLEQQISLMSGFNEEVQQWMLVQGLGELNRATIELDAMLTNWKRGNESAFYEQTVKEFPEGELSQTVYQQVFIDRNRSMAEFVEKLASSKPGRYFVVVGAGHLVGPEGVPALLSKKGHAINRY